MIVLMKGIRNKNRRKMNRRMRMIGNLIRQLNIMYLLYSLLILLEVGYYAGRRQPGLSR